MAKTALPPKVYDQLTTWDWTAPGIDAISRQKDIVWRLLTLGRDDAARYVLDHWEAYCDGLIEGFDRDEEETTYADLPSNAKIASLARGSWIANEEWKYRREASFAFQDDTGNVEEGAALFVRFQDAGHRWRQAERDLDAAIVEEGVACFHPENDAEASPASLRSEELEEDEVRGDHQA